MVRFTSQNSMDAVDLLKENNQRQLVLKGELTEAQHVIRFFSQGCVVSVGPTNQKRNILHPFELPGFHAFRELSCCPSFPSLIQGNA